MSSSSYACRVGRKNRFHLMTDYLLCGQLGRILTWFSGFNNPAAEFLIYPPSGRPLLYLRRDWFHAADVKLCTFKRVNVSRSRAHFWTAARTRNAPARISREPPARMRINYFEYSLPPVKSEICARLLTSGLGKSGVYVCDCSLQHSYHSRSIIEPRPTFSAR